MSDLFSSAPRFLVNMGAPSVELEVRCEMHLRFDLWLKLWYRIGRACVGIHSFRYLIFDLGSQPL